MTQGRIAKALEKARIPEIVSLDTNWEATLAVIEAAQKYSQMPCANGKGIVSKSRHNLVLALTAWADSVLGREGE